METRRSSLWDNIKGILICLVVLGHFLYNFAGFELVSLIVYLIYVFHMPAFVFVSGVFTHDPPKIRKLINAFIIFDAAYLICEYVNLGSVHIISPAYVCWYLLALIVWRFTASLLPKKKIVIPCLFVLSLFSGFIPVSNEFGLTRILSFWVFFAAGYLIGQKGVEGLRSKIRPVFGVLLFITGLAGSYIARLVFGYSKDDMTMMSYKTPEMFAGRFVLLILAFVITISLVIFVPAKAGFLTKIGKNSLSIFLLHRFLTFIYTYFFSDFTRLAIILTSSVLFTVITLILLGSDEAASGVARLIGGTDKQSVRFRRVLSVLLVSAASILFVMNSVTELMFNNSAYYRGADGSEESSTRYIYIYPGITEEQEEGLERCARIVFAGDLILLEDQVRLAYDSESGTYDFSPMFEFTEDEISSADLAIGVYEGPSGGADIGYSTSNYGDHRTLRLNFPDEFAFAVADAGFDLVTTANNHLLDSGLDAALRTNEVLDAAGLMHIGTYANEAQRQEERVRLVDVAGMKAAVLAYTFGSNYHTEDEFFDGDYSYLTSVIVPESSPNYERCYQMVQDDFEYAESLDPDLIIVLPHMGTQFTDEADDFQVLWRQNFIDLGADIVLGDHSHSVQPAFMEEVDGRMTFTAYCPGNYANIYREHNGDASALIEVFIDPETHEIVAGGLIPMWATAQADGNYRPIPVADIMNDDSIRAMLTVDDMARVEEVHRHITGVVFGNEFSTDMIEPDYLFNENGFIRRRCGQIEVTGQMEGSVFLEQITGADSVCFIGDSITQGTETCGVPWYEPVLSLIDGEVYNLSYGGWTTSNVIDNIGNLEFADLYVIAIGTNDLRYDNEETGAVTAEAYIQNMEVIRNAVMSVNPDSTIIYIAPWISYDGDMVSPFAYEEINERRAEFSAALEGFAEANGDIYIDPNLYISEEVGRHPRTYYIIDWIHPNIRHGVELYSEAVIMSSVC